MENYLTADFINIYRKPLTLRLIRKDSLWQLIMQIIAH